MRTTLTLEPDVERLVREAMRREHTSFKDVVNRGLRAARGGAAASGSREPFLVDPHATAL
ncbi:MAG: hypothetical protein H6744_21930, partial [Deltaproteobacteria bacterium]|nr:hypothetical protein [Deltaproteobacteria bacterium]